MLLCIVTVAHAVLSRDESGRDGRCLATLDLVVARRAVLLDEFGPGVGDWAA